MDTYVIATALIRHKDKYLILKRANTKKFAPGEWEFLSGFVDTKEPAEKIILRELREELHVSGEIINDSEIFSFVDKEARWIVVPYMIKISTQDIKTNKKDHSKYKWVTLPELDMYPDLKPFLAMKDMTKQYTGVIIEESLENKDILKHIRIISTKIEKTTKEHKTHWVKKWTLHNIEIMPQDADAVAKKLSKSLDSRHAWYADFENNTHHYIIFKDKIFYIDKTRREEYEKARQYGISLGIPEYQVDFHPETDDWQR